MPPPWGWRNPLRHRIQSGGISSSKVALTQEARGPQSTFTTTNVGDWFRQAEVNILIPGRRQMLFAATWVKVKHSAAAAEFSIRMELADATSGGTEITIALLENVYLATADKWFPVHISLSFDLDAQTPSLLKPNDANLRFSVRNDTSGTLTVHGAGLTDGLIHGFVTGDSSA